MASPSPPPPPPPPPRRGLPPPCWSHDETLALIDCYRVKWHSLRCSNLRAADWDSVSSDLSRRSSLLPSSSPKTSVQCRHKIEKLRKRFRSERLRSLSLRPHSLPSSPWPFFPFMDSLDLPPSLSDSSPPSSFHRLRFSIPKPVRSKISNPSPKIEMRKRREDMDAGGVADALRTVADGFIRMERVKMDMARETQRMRMDMELKRTEMILDSQQRIIHAFVKGVVAGVKRNKAEVSPDG